MLPKVDELLVSADASLRDAMVVLERTAQGVCFVVDGGGVLAGSLSDGDIRRHLLAGGSIEDRVRTASRRDPTFLRAGVTLAEAQKAIDTRVRLVPIVDEAGRVVDYASARRLHHVPVLEPVLRGNELEYVSECVRTGWISSKGHFVTKFEAQLAEFLGVPRTLAVSNGTVALHLAMAALDIGPGDEVIVPDYTFAASINTIIHAGATPVLADVRPDTWTLCPDAVKALIGPRTRAIMPVHIYGHPCHMDELLDLAERHRLAIVEDCAESLGSLYRGRPSGCHGDAAAFSFFGNKVITTGEGGLVAFRDERAYEKARMLRDHGMRPDRRYWHELVGYNYRMTNLQAAVGVAQMEQIDGFVARRREIARRYDSLLADVPFLRPQVTQPWAVGNNWLYTVLVEPDCPVSRDELMDKLMRNGIETRPAFGALHAMPPYAAFGAGRSFPVSTALMQRGLSLPSSVSLSDADVDAVVGCIRAVLRFDDLKRASSG